MLTLYYSPGACSMAAHIALEEAGAQYALKLVSIPKGEQLADEYLQNVNPRGKVPSLRTQDGILTENVAILTYIARIFPHARLLPDEPISMARCLSHMAYLSNTVHPAFTHIVRPGRFATDQSAQENVKATGRENAWKLLQELDGLLGGQEWVLDSRYSVADPYTLVIYGWGKGHGMPIEQLKNYTAFKDRMLQRPAVRGVLKPRRAGCSRADQIGSNPLSRCFLVVRARPWRLCRETQALRIARSPRSNGRFGGAFRNTVHKSMRVPPANRRRWHPPNSILQFNSASSEVSASRWFRRCRHSIAVQWNEGLNDLRQSHECSGQAGSLSDDGWA